MDNELPNGPRFFNGDNTNRVTSKLSPSLDSGY